MPEFNIDRIRQIIGEINFALHKLERCVKLSEDEFLSDDDKLDSGKYNLIVAIEGTIDICNHIVARMGGRAPCDYADCFEILGELEILPDEFVGRLKKMARFRNLLVHLYWQVDNKRVYQFLKKDIQDLKDYLKAVEKIISE